MNKQRPRCKFCGALPKAGKIGKKFEVYCPEMDSVKCPYPPCVIGDTLEEAERKWVEQFGAK